MEEAKVIEFTRIVKTSFRDITRNGWLSFASALVMTLTLLITGLFAVFAVVINKTAEGAQDKVNVAIVNFKNQAGSTDIALAIDEIRGVAGVKEVKYVGKDEALIRFKEQHKDEPLILEAVKEENPLLNSLEVKVTEPKVFETVKSIISGQPHAGFIASFSFEGEKQRTVERIGRIALYINRIGMVLTILFVSMSIMIIFNTVRIAIFSKRTEIEIMQLVGATKRFIRYPFVLEGAIFGLLGAIISIALITAFVGGAGAFISRYFADSAAFYTYLTANLWVMLLGLSVFGVSIGGGSSFVAVTRHLKV